MTAPNHSVRPLRPGGLQGPVLPMPTNAEEVRRAIVYRCAIDTVSRDAAGLAAAVREDPDDFRGLAEDVADLVLEYHRRLLFLERFHLRLLIALKGA